MSTAGQGWRPSTAKRVLAAAGALASLLLGLAPAVRADSSIAGTTCADITSPDGIAYTKCVGHIPSWDGVPIDADITFPQGALTARPLLVMSHGWGNDKTEWESTTAANANPDKDHYNNVWFASQGYTVLTYSDRGFGDSCGVRGASTPTTPACATGWTHLADRRYEIRDLKYLVGVLVDAGVADASHVAVTGGSYGGGHTWLSALEGDTMTVIPSGGSPEDATTVPWTSPGGTPIHMAAGVAKYPWSDLIEALLPNGRASDGVIVPDGDRTSPVGVMKESYVSGLYALGTASGHYAPPGADPTADLQTWYADIQKGEPYLAADPALAGALHQIRDWKSPYYQSALIQRDVTAADEVPVLDVQGWTDELFPESQGVALYNELKRADPNWPVTLAVSDVGHAGAQNKSGSWSWINQRATNFLNYYMLGSGTAPSLDVQAQETTCGAGAADGPIHTAAGWSQLTPGRVTFALDQASATSSATPTQPIGVRTDPIVTSESGQKGCYGTSVADLGFAGGSNWYFHVSSAFTLVGEPVVTLPATIAGADAEVDVRLWDEDLNTGLLTLVTRGNERWTGTPGDYTLTFPLHGNAWTFGTGHTVLVEVLQQDTPYLRPDNLPSAITYAGISVTFPTS